MARSRGKPYASVILPAFSRHLCMDTAIRSILAQTVDDIELIIIGDGPTPEVQSVARSWTERDARVRYLPFRKGTGAGHRHRDRVVRSDARAERIFYCDDDDIFLHDHVERLGKSLDDGADVVDTPIVAATPSGHVDAGVYHMDIPEVRDLVGSRASYKAIYDTHLAHTAGAYGRAVAAAPRRGEELFPVMLTGLARDPSLRWQRVVGMTALSIVGKPRSTWSERDRAGELAAWNEASLREGFAEATWRDAHRGAYAADLATALLKEGHAAEVARNAAMASLDRAAQGAAQHRIDMARTAIRAVVGDPVGEDEALALYEDLEGSQPKAWLMTRWILRLVVPHVGWESLSTHLRALPATPIRLCLLAEAEARLSGRVSADTLDTIEALEERHKFGAFTQLARTHLEVLGDEDGARTWLARARALPWPRGLGGEYHALARRLGAPKLKPSRARRAWMALAPVGLRPFRRP